MLRIRWDALLGRSAERSTAAREPDVIIGYVQEAFADARARVRREDETAVILLVTTGAAAGAVVAGLLNGYWRPGELSSKIEWLWWAGMFFWLMGILMLVGALYHRIAGLAGRTLERRRFYPGGFVGQVRPGPRSGDRVDLLVLEIRRLSAVGDAKRRYIRRGVWLMLISITCCALSVFVSRLL
ncbi:hypothetical protein OG884_06435 [Streptosporangium sp. NBC_01755]|uniref:hypothetical protein n=1 Tax=Streptosporangium sp. NBC_01755 TaxID=2975949 RepID=UPI002DDB2EAC|nr:hypothetical protein [Streptosporangium sp. NBC_01755]WSD01562.1 hypothetical protein OG884_06435 [Streptosporangium sp. NBC_01755]